MESEFLPCCIRRKPEQHCELLPPCFRADRPYQWSFCTYSYAPIRARKSMIFSAWCSRRAFSSGPFGASFITAVYQVNTEKSPWLRLKIISQLILKKSPPRPAFQESFPSLRVGFILIPFAVHQIPTVRVKTAVHATSFSTCRLRTITRLMFG